MIAMRRSGRVFRLSRFWMTSRWPEKSPWEKLSRATFIPARIICSITIRDCEAGPMVQTSFVL